MELQEIKDVLGQELKSFKDGLQFVAPEDMEKKFSDFKAEMSELLEQKGLGEKVNALQLTLDEMKNSQTPVVEEKKSIAKAIEEVFETKGLKTISDIKAIVGQEFEVKADNPLIASSYVGDYYVTKPVSPLRLAPLRPYAFLNQGLGGGIIEQDKNKLLWTVGSRVNNVAYIGELADATTTVDGSTVTALDKTRELSKIVARAIITSESLADRSQLAQRCQQNLIEGTELFLDGEIFNGIGADGTNPNKVYGVTTNQVTAFDSTKVPSVTDPNVSDLAGAMVLQAKLNYHTCNTVWMSDSLAFKYQRTKDKDGQYVINRLVDGTMMMGGLKVITSELFGGTTEKMLVGDPQKIQLWIKQGLNAEFLRVPKTDAYELYVYARQQVLVEDEDIKGLIYCDNVDVALGLIETKIA